MTEEQIIKSLECCIKSSHFGECFENKCPMVSEKGCKVGKEGLYPYALKLINKQKAEIEKLKSNLDYCENDAEYWEVKYKKAKSEAIKEFAERLKEQVSKGIRDYDITEIVCEIIDNLVKEMTEESDDL